MKKIILPLIIILAQSITAQTGPGGVGNSTNNIMWLSADSLPNTLSNTDPISSWNDISGNSTVVTQGTAASQPTFVESGINGYPTVNFDGTNDYFQLPTGLNNSGITFLIVSKLNGASYTSIAAFNKHHISYSNGGLLRAEYSNGSFSVGKSSGSFSISSVTTNSSTGPQPLDLTNGSTLAAHSRENFFNITSESIGALFHSGSFNFFLNGEIAEMIVFNERLSTPKRKIVSNHLAAKYNLTAESNLYNYKANHGKGVIGIGQESGSSHLSSQGSENLIISNPTTLGNGDYALVGNNGADFTTVATVPAGVVERWNRTWRIDKTNSPGNIDLQFFLDGGGFAATSDYLILAENSDGNFSNGGTRVITGGVFNAADGGSITFSNVNLSDGEYFTLAEVSGTIESIASGEWNDVNTWSCNCIPANTDIVIVKSPHLVEVNANSAVLDLTINIGASMSFDGLDTLKVFGDFINTGIFLSNNGTVVSAGNERIQDYKNNSTSRLDLNNFYSANPFGVSFTAGAWGVKRNLQITAGGMDVSSIDSMLLISTSTQTATIGEGMSSAFTGDFIIQRYLSARNSNFANFSSPIVGATVAQLDDDLVLSGVGGANGNATSAGGGTFRSVYKFNRNTDAHEALTALTDPLTSGIGYEVYLASNLTTFNDTTVDYLGVPFSGSTTGLKANSGHNLIGNPFQSFIDWDLVTKTVNTTQHYWVYNSDNGSYDFYTGGGKPAIQPGHGFWVFSNGGDQPVTFKENAKVSFFNSDFTRKKQISSALKFTLKSKENNYQHSMLLDLDPSATDQLNYLEDMVYLPSPMENAPAIFSRASNSSEKLIKNSLNSYEPSKVIPIEIIAGNSGSFTLSSENISEVYDSYNCIYLKDNLTEQAIDLSVDNSYTFDSDKGESNRFKLIVSNNYDDCQNLIKNGNFEQELDFNLKLINNNGYWSLNYTLDDNLTILDISIYNLNGQLVLNPISFSASGAGSYSISELNELNGIYLIQVKTKDGVLNKTVKL